MLPLRALQDAEEDMAAQSAMSPMSHVMQRSRSEVPPGLLVTLLITLVSGLLTPSLGESPKIWGGVITEDLQIVNPYILVR